MATSWCNYNYYKTGMHTKKKYLALFSVLDGLTIIQNCDKRNKYNKFYYIVRSPPLI